jgi:hypothetical protein
MISRGSLAGLFCAAMLGISSGAAPLASADTTGYGLASAEVSETTTQAGAHPDLAMNLEWKQDPAGAVDSNGLRFPYARTKDLTIALPPGLLGNPTGIPQCTPGQLLASVPGFTGLGSPCPRDSQVGLTVIYIYGFTNTGFAEPIYNMPSPGGDTVARLGFVAQAYPVFIDISVRSDGDYGLTAKITGAPSLAPIVKAKTTIWGVPASQAHDSQRILPSESKSGGVTEFPPHPSGLAPTPFLSNPTRCGVPRQVVFEADSYQLPDQVSTLAAQLPQTSGCGLLEFAPAFAATPTSRDAGAPTGLEALLEVPQDEDPGGFSTAQLRDAAVALPKGMTLAPGAADGLQACTAQQVGLGTLSPAACPDGSKIGSIEIDVPGLERVLKGVVYLRSPEPGRLFRVWLVSDELGVHAKIPGEINADPVSGQLTSLFLDAPQVPLRQLRLRLKGGSRGVLANPPACGTYRTHFEFTPWSGGLAAVGDSPMTIDGGCATAGFSPALDAGTADPRAGSFSPFVLNLTRPDGQQNIARLDLTMPRGLLAKLAGVALCSDAEAAAGGCPASSAIGTTTLAVGPGATPLWIPQPAKDPTAVYLAGPYKGAPYSLVVKVPAQAGPFDLGTQVVRTGTYVNPETAQVTVKSDPLPQILEGVPISYRTVHVDVDKPQFTINPTRCSPAAVRAAVTSDKGVVANLSSRFQATRCRHLGFAPKLTMALDGGTERSDYPALKAVLKARSGDANLSRAVVALPHSEFLAQDHIDTVCTRPQFAAENCPAGSIYGRAKAVTPLLDRPLEGPVYLRSSSNPLPDLVVALRGPVDIDLVGRIDSVDGGIRVSFDSVPDAPVSKFVLTMKGGAKGLLVNSRDLCEEPSFSAVELDGQNGKTADQNPQLRPLVDGNSGKAGGLCRPRADLRK